MKKEKIKLDILVFILNVQTKQKKERKVPNRVHFAKVINSIKGKRADKDEAISELIKDGYILRYGNANGDRYSISKTGITFIEQNKEK